jgi:hypothetical protein
MIGIARIRIEGIVVVPVPETKRTGGVRKGRMVGKRHTWWASDVISCPANLVFSDTHAGFINTSACKEEVP